MTELTSPRHRMGAWVPVQFCKGCLHFGRRQCLIDRSVDWVAGKSFERLAPERMRAVSSRGLRAREAEYRCHAIVARSRDSPLVIDLGLITIEDGRLLSNGIQVP